jgi:hypothetical protein
MVRIYEADLGDEPKCYLAYGVRRSQETEVLLRTSAYPKGYEFRPDLVQLSKNQGGEVVLRPVPETMVEAYPMHQDRPNSSWFRFADDETPHEALGANRAELVSEYAIQYQDALRELYRELEGEIK